MKLVQINLQGERVNKLPEITLYGTFGDDITLKEVIALTSQLGDAKRVLVRLHTPGGDPLEGMAVYHHLKGLGIIIDTQNDGLVASMGTLIYAIGIKRYAARYTKFMVHQGKGSTYGNSMELYETAKLLDSINQEQIEIFSPVINKPKEWVEENWIKKGSDHFMTAKDAKDIGFVNQPLHDGNRIPEPEETLSLSLMASHFDKYLFTKQKTNMELELLSFELNKVEGVQLPTTASVTQVAAEVAKVVSTNLKLTDSLSKSEASVIELQAKLAEQEKKGLTDKATALVDTAISLKKITKDQQAHYLSLASKSDEGYVAVKGIFDSMTGYQSPTEMIKNGGAVATEADKELLKLDWDAAMKSNKMPVIKTKFPEHYEQIFEAKFGKKPSK